jgi:transcriptional regulator with XRE-family HTH domain
MASNADDLRQAREALGLSQRDLAAKAQVSQSTVRDLERDGSERTHVITTLREELKQHIKASVDADHLDTEAVAALGRLTNYSGVYPSNPKEA